MEGHLALLLAEPGGDAGDAAGAVVDDRAADVAALEQAGAGLLGVAGELLVEVVALADESVVRVRGQLRPVELEADTAADDAQPLVAQPAGLLGDVDAHGDELLDRARGEAVAAHLLARELGLLQEQHVETGLGEVVRGRGAGRPRAHDDHIGGVLGEGLGHDGHGGISPSRNLCADRHWTWAVYSAELITRLKGCPVNRPLPAVRLRVPTHEDAVAWHRVFADPEVMEFHGGRPAELSVYEELTARQRRHDAEHGFCLWTLLDESGEVIGFTGAQPWPPDWGPVGETEIGWRLGRAHWGKGYATAAARGDAQAAAGGRGAGCGGDGPAGQRAVRRGGPEARHGAGGDLPASHAERIGALLPAQPQPHPHSRTVVVCYRKTPTPSGRTGRGLLCQYRWG